MFSTRSTIIAVAAVFSVLSLPASAADEASAARQDCSVCDDPTWPEIQDPAPTLALEPGTGSELASVQGDPTWPEIQDPAPALALAPETDGALASVQDDPTWPAMATVAPHLAMKPVHAKGQVASRR